MKIIVIQDRLRSGGTERQSILLARAFGAAGHRSALLTFRPGGALGPSAVGLDWRALQPVDFGLDGFAPGLCRAVREFRPDIALCMGRMANCHAGRLQSRAGAFCSVVASMRTGKPLPWIMRRSFRRARHVIANSEAGRDRLVAGLGLPPDRITVIGNALVFPGGPATKRNEALRARQGAGPGTTVLACVAMFRPEKGQGELLEIAAGLPKGLDWQLWLVGDGPTLQACARIASRLELGERVRFLGFDADPARFYAAADIAVHASSSESLSNFIIEAQAWGLPAVAYDAQGMRECFVPDRTGWAIRPGDRESFRAALACLIREPPSDRAGRRAEARAFAKARFDPARQVAAHLELFRRIVRQSP